MRTTLNVALFLGASCCLGALSTAAAFQSLAPPSVAVSKGSIPSQSHDILSRMGTAASFHQQSFLMSSIMNDEVRDEKTNASAESLASNSQDEVSNEAKGPSAIESIIDGLPFIHLFKARQKLPPMHVDDTNVLLYDIFLIVNLTLSISFWVTHRMEFQFLPFAFSEGCLLSIFWIASGLYHGMFLYSAVDGHYGSADERGGPKAAAALALNTYVNAVNLRLLFAFLVAVFEHRPVGMSPGEQLLPLEVGFGLLLMSSWRALHSIITPRF